MLSYAELFVKCIENQGIKHIFGIAREENMVISNG
jgi:thiamine pyrophosphate-dependent acetolactate synthase large subunit-like protein